MYIVRLLLQEHVHIYIKDLSHYQYMYSMIYLASRSPGVSAIRSCNTLLNTLSGHSLRFSKFVIPFKQNI